MRVVHVITNLVTGGAEMMLLKTIKTTKNSVEHIVISLAGLGTIGPRLRALEVEVHALNIPVGRVSVIGAARLASLIHKLEPDFVQGWMYHANLAILIAKYMTFADWPLGWSIRTAIRDLSNERPLTQMVIKVCALASSRVRLIIYNSEVARAQHEALGYNKSAGITIPNGFDTELFRPSPRLRNTLRQRFGYLPSEIVIGNVGRNHPVKDYGTLLLACSRLRNLRTIKIMLVGHDLQRLAERPDMAPVIQQLGDRLRLLPEQENISELLNVFDIFVLSSAWGEAFPNVLGEAMAMELPCVTTDVGDARIILDDPEYVIPPADVSALTLKIDHLISLGEDGRKTLAKKARHRIVGHYALEVVSREYEGAWRRLAGVAMGGQ